MTRARWEDSDWSCGMLLASGAVALALLWCAGMGVGTAQRKAQGNSQKVASASVPNPHMQVFEAALRVAAKFGYTSEVDPKTQVISFTIGPVGKAGSDYLTAYFHGLPDGCGSEDKVCTATKVEVKRCVTLLQLLARAITYGRREPFRQARRTVVREQRDLLLQTATGRVDKAGPRKP